MHAETLTVQPQKAMVTVLQPKKCDSLVDLASTMPVQSKEVSKGIDTLFNPREHPLFRSVPAAELVAFNPRTKLSQLRRLSSKSRQPRLDHTTLVIFVSGACRGTAGGTRPARASYGIYFGDGSLYNASDLLSQSLPQTIACAEVEALAAAIDMVSFINLRYAKFDTVKLVTDSQYLVEAMATAWLPESECQMENMVKLQLRSPVHLEKITQLRKKIELMEREDGIHCQMWQLTEDENSAAGQLALEALTCV
jgi:ribonuclease HI